MLRNNIEKSFDPKQFDAAVFNIASMVIDKKQVLHFVNQI